MYSEGLYREKRVNCWVHTYLYTYTHTYTHIYLYVYTYACVYVWVYVYIYIFILLPHLYLLKSQSSFKIQLKIIPTWSLYWSVCTWTLNSKVAFLLLCIYFIYVYIHISISICIYLYILSPPLVCKLLEGKDCFCLFVPELSSEYMQTHMDMCISMYVYV